ncbi:MAG: YgjV family protein [Butyricicoccus sp.]|nr:YgjV family protein [Butyricicoccus sp.]MBQ8584979.1 YgjV family protein [Butyricicoccus sp.]
MYPLITQAIGFIAMLLWLWSFQIKSSRTLVLCQTLGNTAYVIHYLMLGAYTGCISLLLSVLNNTLLSTKRVKWCQWSGWKWIFSAAFIISSIATWKNGFSILPCVASIASVLANWSCNGKSIRYSKLFVSGPGWIVYNTYVHSYSGVLCELACIGSVLISIHRHGIKALDQES